MTTMTRLDCIENEILLEFIFNYCKSVNTTINESELMSSIKKEENLRFQLFNLKNDHSYILNINEIVKENKPFLSFNIDPIRLLAKVSIFINAYLANAEHQGIITKKQFRIQARSYFKQLLHHKYFENLPISTYLNYTYQLSINERKRDFLSEFYSDLTVRLIMDYLIDENIFNQMGENVKEVFHNIPDDTILPSDKLVTSFKDLSRSENMFFCFVVLYNLTTTVTDFTIKVEEVVADTFAQYFMPKDIIEAEQIMLSKLGNPS